MKILGSYHHDAMGSVTYVVQLVCGACATAPKASKTGMSMK